MTTIMYVSAILAVVIILTIIGVLSRYRRCKPNQVLVVYGKTGGEKKSAIVRSKAELEVNKAEAERMEEVGKNKAEADKEAAIAIQDSEAQIKKAEAEKNASIGYNNAQKEVAVSVSELQIIKAQSEKRPEKKKLNRKRL